MKATGIVRRIDELGRIVVPKEIRRVLRIREGDPLEIFTDKDGEIVLKKYSPIGELSLFAQEYVEAIAASLGCGVCVSDRDQIIAVAGIPKKELLGKSLHRELEDAINDREAIEAFDLLCRLEGIIPALESSHAVAQAVKNAPKLGKDQSIVVCLSGRGDKDMENIRAYKNGNQILKCN